MIDRQWRQGGFTLIELAVVLIIISLLLVALLGPLSTRIEQSDRETTIELLDDAKDALYGFAVANGRLPCPDQDGDGEEDQTGTPAGCAVAEGRLPWEELGVHPEDAWGNNFLYRVTAFFAADTSAVPPDCFPTPPPPPPPPPPTEPPQTLGVSFKLCSEGDITIRDRVGAGAVTITDEVPAVIISFGKNGRDAPTPSNDPALSIGGDVSAHEAENDDGANSIFVLKQYSQDDAEEFDDLLAWISPNVLRNRMVVGGRLP